MMTLSRAPAAVLMLLVLAVAACEQSPTAPGASYPSDADLLQTLIEDGGSLRPATPLEEMVILYQVSIALFAATLLDVDETVAILTPVLTAAGHLSVGDSVNAAASMQDMIVVVDGLADASELDPAVAEFLKQAAANAIIQLTPVLEFDLTHDAGTCGLAPCDVNSNSTGTWFVGWTDAGAIQEPVAQPRPDPTAPNGAELVGWMRWEGLAESVLAYGVVDRAEVQYNRHVSTVGLPDTEHFGVHQVLASWTESITAATAPPIEPVSFINASPFQLFDVTGLVRGWVDGTIPNHGIAVKPTLAGGYAGYHDRLDFSVVPTTLRVFVSPRLP